MSPFAGTAVWIWNLINCDGGNYDVIAARLHAAGVTTIYLKSDDGGHWFHQSDSTGPVAWWRACYELQRRGFIVCAWGYHYGAVAGTVYYGYAVAGWQEEAQRAIDTINYRPNEAPDYRGPDGYIFDVEAEYEGRSAVAATVIANVKAAIAADFPLAYAPLPAIRYHLQLPYRQFADAGCVMLPQLYWTGLQWSVEQTVELFYGDAERYQLLGQPVAPAYEDAPGDRPGSGEIEEFASRLIAHGASGTSVWSYEHLDEAAWSRVGVLVKLLAPPAPVPEPVPVPEPTPEPTPEPRPLFDDAARWQLVKFVANGSGVSDIVQWVGQHTDA